MENKNEYKVLAIRYIDDMLIAVQTNTNDIISLDKMKSLIAIDGKAFYVNDEKGNKIYFEFDQDEIINPNEKILKTLMRF